MSTLWTEENFVGERLCLDFINTKSGWGHVNDEDHDRLATFDDFMQWLSFAKEKGDCEAHWEIAFEAVDPHLAERVMCDVRKLRKHLFEVFHAFSHGRQPEMPNIAAIYETLSTSIMFVEPVDKPNDLAGPENHVRILKPAGLIYPIAHSAARLLVEDCLCYIKECADDTCGWVFLDCSKSHRRRWCDMKTCGNRAKARRHYQKKCEEEAVS